APSSRETPMPLNVPITEDMVRGLSPDDATWQKAQEIATSSRLLQPGVSADGTWLLADAKGSGKEPYHVSADFVDPNSPVLRSDSPSRQTPDKYGLALLLKYARQPDSFGAREPGDDLLAKREKKVAAEERKKFGPGAPKREKKSAAEKQRAAQREGLEVIDRLLIDLVSAGHWFEEGRVEKLERQAKNLGDSHLPAATHALRKLLILAKQKGIGDEERQFLGADLIAQLWAIVQRGKTYLDGRLPDGDTQAEADALVEEILDRPWQTNDLKEKGYWKTNLTLLELAYERTDDDSRQQRIESSDLIDLNSGEIFQAVAYRSYKGLNPVPEQPSYTTPLTISEAAVYPGFITRRIRWEKDAETIGRPSPTALEKAYGLAKTDFAEAVEQFRRQLHHPLAPHEALFLLRAEHIGKIGDRQVVLEDAAGNRIEAADRRKDYSNVANLVRAAAMLGRDRPAILVHLFVQPVSNTIVALPVAALTSKHQLRLGL
ncbi:MAG TPA: hypothetical protein VKJ00_12630, partial [Thermoanaerobaculia bacterium]|nr:hypothetical protein [Thermoanaerobaculia bacterium]